MTVLCYRLQRCLQWLQQAAQHLQFQQQQRPQLPCPTQRPQPLSLQNLQPDTLSAIVYSHAIKYLDHTMLAAVQPFEGQPCSQQSGTKQQTNARQLLQQLQALRQETVV